MNNAKLAILGGSPAFDKPLHVGCPNIGNTESFYQRIGDILDRRWLSNDGPMVQEFEKRIANFVGVKHCVAMCNGTIALEITIRALGLSGEVIIPSFTFIATAHALQWQKITPVFCDIDEGHTINPYAIAHLITPRTTGIIGVHTWGRPCDADIMAEIAERRGLTLLFDAAHALGCSYRNKMIGGFGKAEIFSFHATKFLNTLEGGAVVTNDNDLAEKLRYMRNFGFAKYDQVDHVGSNGKMNEVSGAMGLTSLESIDEFIEHNRRNYQSYQHFLADIPGLELLKFDETQLGNYQYIIIEVEDHVTGVTRDELIAILHAENILARRYFYPGCHRMQPYASLYPHSADWLPRTEEIAQRVMVLPTGTSISEVEIAEICRILQLVVTAKPEVRREFCSSQALVTG